MFYATVDAILLQYRRVRVDDGDNYGQETSDALIRFDQERFDWRERAEQGTEETDFRRFICFVYLWQETNHRPVESCKGRTVWLP